jgi:invasion protein IalB
MPCRRRGFDVPMRSLFSIAMLSLVAVGLPATGFGQAAPVPGATTPTQTYKSWALDCVVPKTGEGAGKQVCFIHHEARSKTDATMIAARVVVRRAGPDKKLALIVQLPPNSVQASGISVAIDGNKAHPMAIQACLPKFCYGAIEMTNDLEGEAKAGQQMTLTFSAKDKGSQQVPVPLAGITAALGALAKTGS